MSSISNITSSCRGLLEQMNRSAQGWNDVNQRTYYNRRIYPLIDTASAYQEKVYNYMRLLDEYEHRIASLSGITPMGTGIGENELYRQHLDPLLMEQILSKHR